MSTPADLSPCICFGAVMHRREVRADNLFTYRSAFVRVPLSQWHTLSVPLLGMDRFNVFGLYRRDHGPRDGGDLLLWIRDVLARQGLSRACDGEVVLHTMPRIFGYVFNPVSFWFCHDAAGSLRAVLAEVNNTFGERHNYLIHHDDLRPISRDDTLQARKVFHVSPFFPVQGSYRFRFGASNGHHSVDIDYYIGEQRQLRTRVSGQARMLDGAGLRRWLLRHPLMTFGVVLRIHWQALRLALRRVPFFRKPLPPLEETSR